MSIGAFVDKKHQPSAEEIHQAIGPKLPVWEELVRFIREHYPSDEDFKFLYGKKYGWALRQAAYPYLGRSGRAEALSFRNSG